MLQPLSRFCWFLTIVVGMAQVAEAAAENVHPESLPF
jgi:hypothetical protein